MCIAFLAACGGDAATLEGGALGRMPSRWVYRPAVPVPPGQRIVMVVTTLKNVAERPVRITRLELKGARGFPEVARLASATLLPRGVPHNDAFPLGRYLTYPPLTRARQRCQVAELVEPAGHMLLPRGPQAQIVLAVDPVAPGKAGFRALRVTYEYEGLTFHQVFRFGMRLRVREGAKGLRETRDERRCGREFAGTTDRPAT